MPTVYACPLLLICIYAGPLFSIHYLRKHHHSGTLHLENISPQKLSHPNYSMPSFSLGRLSTRNAGLRSHEYIWQIPGQTHGYARLWLQ